MSTCTKRHSRLRFPFCAFVFIVGNANSLPSATFGNVLQNFGKTAAVNKYHFRFAIAIADIRILYPAYLLRVAKQYRNRAVKIFYLTGLSISTIVISGVPTNFVKLSSEAFTIPRAAAAVTSEQFTGVALTLQDQNGTILLNEHFDTIYQAQ